MRKKILHTLLLCLFAVFSMSAFAQKTVTGVVSDDSGDLLPGASVVIKGTTKGVITDIDGKFNISVPDASSVLVISFVGLEKQEITVGNQTAINVSLSSSSIDIDAVVVTALGISKEKKALGYSVSAVENEDINQGGSMNVLKALDGKVTGVNITSLSSDPTSSSFVTIRNATSIKGLKSKNISQESQPLYVIDGIPVGKGRVGVSGDIDVGNIMSEMNPDDIESINVLKGASAAALYGSEAGSGVIMITTKSGSGGKKGVGVSVNSSFVFDDVYATLATQSDYMQGERYNSFSTSSNSANGPRIGSKFAAQSWQQWDMTNQEYFNGPLDSYTQEDRVKAFMETGHTATNNVSVTGNYDKGNYRLSYTNLEHKSVIPNSRTRRNTVAFSSVYNILDNLKVSSSATLTHTYAPNKVPVSGRADKNGVVWSLYNMTPNIAPMSELKAANDWINGYEGIYQNSPFIQDKGEEGHRYAGDEADQVKQNNPYFVVRQMLNTFTRDNIFGKVQLDWTIAEPLTLTLRSGADKTTYNFQHRQPWDSRNKRQGYLKLENSSSLVVNTDMFLTFEKQFGDLNINAMGGVNYRFNDSFYQSQDGKNLARPNDFTLGALDRTAIASSYSWAPGRYMSAYGTVSAGYKGMFYVDVTGRNDWSGIIEQDRNHYFYPSASASWILSETMELPEWINLAKARFGIAQVGHGIGTYPNVDTYGFASNTWGGATLGTIGGELVDPNIKPEVNTSQEWGIDVSLFNNRVSAEFTSYTKKHENQIDLIPVVATTGFSNLRTNVGTVTATGIEASLTVVPVKTKDFEWNFTGNFTKGQAEITYMREGFSDAWIGYASYTMMRLREGEIVGNLYNEEGDWLVQDGKYAGMRILKQDSGTPVENDDADNRALLGNINPDFILGARTGLRYKRWNLNAVASYRQGGVYSSQTKLIMDDDGKSPWSVTGDGEFWEGGRAEAGGFAWPDPADMIISWEDYDADAMPAIDGGFNDASYCVGVTVDPRSGLDPEGRDYADQTFDWNGQTLPVYILNGEDPLTTHYRPAEEIVGNTWDFSQTRTFDATHFKLREVTLSYDLPRNFTQKFKCQGGSISFIAKNVYFWTKSGRNEDPESAFGGPGKQQGVAYMGLPQIRSLGARINLNF